MTATNGEQESGAGGVAPTISPTSGSADVPNYRAMTPGDFNDAMSDDAMKWADAFCQLNPGTDHEKMFGWFANVIERSHDYRKGRLIHNDGAFADFVEDVMWQRRFMRDMN